MKTKFIILLSILFIIIYSCSKNDNVEKTTGDKQIKSEDISYDKYQQGINAFNKGDWGYAKMYFAGVDKESKYYNEALEKMKICSNKQLEGSVSSQNESKQNNKKEKIVPITNDKLVKQFRDNEISASNKYKEKIIQVVGKIKSVSDSKNIWGERIIKVELGEYLSEEVDCHFKESDLSELSNLKNEQSVIIEGFCGGTYTFGVVHLFDCVIIKK